jgi:tRNA/tmRNA/rRNA uracil-C5-methylase (TrmA/RlmC/RlmD family)
VGLALGDTLTLTIGDVAFGGEGVARCGDFVVFVPFVTRGEVVEAQIIEVKRNFARARLVRVAQPSSERVAPPCSYFGACGGCQYQHLEYQAQLKLKNKQVRDLLQRIGGINPLAVAEIVPSPQTYGYRNRLMIRSQWDKFKQGLNIGFIRADNRLVVDIDECKIVEPALNEQIRYVRANPPPKGGLKIVLRIFPEGWEVPPDSFFQNNFSLLPKLVETTRDLLKQSGSRYLLDIYCGVGFFAIELADSVERFIGVEYDRPAIRAARKNAAARSRGNGEFRAGKAEELLPELLTQSDPRATTVLVDPPRKGCAPALLQALRQARPLQLIYVSCDPATLARDLNVLCRENVFNLARVVPFDMFPQTAHVECVADLRSNL